MLIITFDKSILQIFSFNSYTMKVLNLIGWASAGIGALMILLALISLIIGKNLFGVGHAVNYFHAANSFLLLTIALFIVVNRCECNKK
jgi:hypothetical protein